MAADIAYRSSGAPRPLRTPTGIKRARMESRFSALRQPADAPNGSSKLERAIRVIPKKLADGCVQVLYEATGKDAALDPDLPRQLPKESW
ncbi:MAG: hypothetical protein QN136_08255, partial [Armatimonadota bacterium]|nr:hypothetical protein [Armatimonadota bacterium]